MRAITEDQRALFLLLSVLLYLILTPFLQGDRIGEMILVFSLYIILVAASVELAANHLLVRPTMVLALLSVVLGLIHYFHPSGTVSFLHYAVLVVFLGFVAVGLFLYLGRPGPITPGHLYSSVSLYFIIALLWAGIYSLIHTGYPDAFLEPGSAMHAKGSGGSLLYFSLATLTTLSFGDIVPVHPVARTFAALESATGILYIAITVARLVSGYQRAAK
ncbi:MAG TPA: ion channel [Candidatus Sulfotelmatobacter sp.]|nr:ion channel [Candidatus Sulfotelmatobacter sp.]